MKNSTQHLYQWLEIDKSRFLHNVQLLKEHIHPDISVVVKGNAYGHDLETAVELFYEAGIRRFCIYHPQHALKVKAMHADCQVIAMGPVQMDEIRNMVENGIELYIWDTPFIDHLSQQATSWSKAVRLHIEIETGMYRTGIEPKQLIPLLGEIKNAEKLRLKGICTHFSGADEPDNLDRIQGQFDRWNQIKEQVKDVWKEDIEWHGPNSAAGIELPSDTFTFARVGLLAYGFFPSEHSMNSWPVPSDIPKPTIRLMSRTSGRNIIPAGEFTGYGKSYCPQRNTPTMIVPLGYADGFPRTLSHSWKVKMGGQLYPTLGRINMNMTVIEAPAKDFDPQQPVILIDKNPPYDWYQAAEISGRFIYELLTCLSPEIPRVLK